MRCLTQGLGTAREDAPRQRVLQVQKLREERRVPVDPYFPRPGHVIPHWKCFLWSSSVPYGKDTGQSGKEGNNFDDHTC